MTACPDQSTQHIRITAQQARKALPLLEQQRLSARIVARVLALKQYREAQHLALYSAVNGEVDLQELWQTAVTDGKTCYFPVLSANVTLLFLPATLTTPFVRNHVGIPEPVVDSALARAPSALDLMCLPLVAFDARCSRLGMGGGYYDRTLAHSRPPCLLGVAYDVQRQAALKIEPWDVPLDAVITPSMDYWR